jgi:hypothetical protein
LLEGAGANGFVGELWTLDRIAAVVKRLTGARHHPAWVWGAAAPPAGLEPATPGPPGCERNQDAIDR